MTRSPELLFTLPARRVFLVASRIAGVRDTNGEWQSLSPACIHITWMVASTKSFRERSGLPAQPPVFAAAGGAEIIVPACGPSEPMNRYENQTFENQHVILDDGVYVNCKFKNCSLEYSGGDVYVQNCQGEGCQLVWRGAAQRTVLLLQGLGLMVPPPPLPGGDPSSRVN
jgi:hypothetical protein